MIQVAVLGYGIVGSGVVEVIKKNGVSISNKAGQEIRVKKILDIRDFPDSPDKDLLTKDAEEIFKDPEISIVVETIGGAGIAYEFTKRALLSGRSVVSSNKELVATHGPELLQFARQNQVSYLFEASVGGGIPIIRPLNQCLAANEIQGIIGILNGTTNYILTQMRREGMDFGEALKGAQQKGYAEANPTADVEGHDTCRKIAILSSIAYGQFVDYKNIPTTGITQITLADMEYAEAMDSVIKLIACSKRVGEQVYARVSPAIVSKSHPLANVEDVFNAIVVKGDAIGDAMFYGRGAGKLPTASAVVADVIDIVKLTGVSGRSVWEKKDYNNMLDGGKVETSFFVRVTTRNGNEARKYVAQTFGKVDIVTLDKPGYEDEFGFVTATEPEGVLSQKVERLRGIGSIKEVVNAIHIEHE